MRRLILLAVLLVASAVALPIGPALAAQPTVATFDDLAPFTTLRDQYAARGVFFGDPLDFGITTGRTNTLCGDGLRVVAGGITGQDAIITCTGAGDVALFGYTTAFHFDEERRGVSFDLRSPFDDQTPASQFKPATVRVFGVGRVLLETRAVSLPKGQIVHLDFTRPGPEIVTVMISGLGGSAAGVEIDNISAVKDDKPPPPRFEIGLGRPSVEVVEGASASVPVHVLRYNGSQGPVTLSVPELPAGIAATKIEPNPATGLKPPTLTITADAPATGDRQVPITAASGSPATTGELVGGGLVQTVRIVTALQAAGLRTNVVPGCGDAHQRVPVSVRGGFSGPIDVEVIRKSGPVGLPLSHARLNATGDGTLNFDLALNQPLGARGDSGLELRFNPLGRTPVTASVGVFEESLEIDDASPRRVFPPEAVISQRAAASVHRNEVTIAGRFPLGCSPTFRDDRGKQLTVLDHTLGAADGTGGSEPDGYRLRLPDAAVSTAVHAFGPLPGELARSPRVDVITFRNGPALSVANAGANAGSNVTWDDFERAFGKDDAETCYSFFGCARSAKATEVFESVRDFYATNPGLCFGYSTMALVFDRDSALPPVYAPGAVFGWQVLPFAEGTAIKQQVVRWQLSYRDTHWRDYVSGLKADVPTLAQFRARLQDALVKQDAVMLTLWQGTTGHAVVAYDMTREGDTLSIRTYNPNLPYTPSEETTGAAHDAQLGLSTITVQPKAVFSPGQPNGTWSLGSPSWTGDLSQIEILDRMPPSDADLGSSWLADLVGDPGSAAVSSIRVDGREALAPDRTPRRGSGVGDEIDPTGGAGRTTYRLTPGRTYDLTLRGRRAGTYGEALVGDTAGAAVRDLRTATGQLDHVTVTAGRARIGLATGARATPARISLWQRAGRTATRTAAVALNAGGRGAETASLAGGVLQLRHAGPTAMVTVTLGSTGLGAPASVTTAPIRLARGDRLSLRPRSWADVIDGVRVTIRDARGKVRRSGRVRLRATHDVSLGAVTARLGGARRVEVRGNVARTGSAPLLAISAEALRGSRVVARAGVSRRGARVRKGRFAIRVRFRRLPRGARIRVTVTLADEAAGFAAARRRVNAR